MTLLYLEATRDTRQTIQVTCINLKSPLSFLFIFYSNPRKKNLIQIPTTSTLHSFHLLLPTTPDNGVEKHPVSSHGHVNREKKEAKDFNKIWFEFSPYLCLILINTLSKSLFDFLFNGFWLDFVNFKLCIRATQIMLVQDMKVTLIDLCM